MKTAAPRRLIATLLSLIGALGLAGCGSSGPTLTGPAEIGRDIAQSSGCPACHGLNGEGKTGPAWVGLAGSERTLDDGTVVVADTDYLRRSILDPGSQQIAGYTIEMPINSLTDDDVDAIVTYIEELR